MSDQKICPTCGTEYPLSERFCPRDGTALRSANVQADLLGSVVADRYHIIKKLGKGGMGTVYLAEHVKMGRKSALKVMNPGMNTDPDAIARFNREASNASRLSHPNICAIYDFGETSDGLIYLAMEFIEGSSLTSLVEKNGSMPAPRVGSIIHQTADALQVAHDAGIVHRDLKPDNIMIAKTRDGADLVKVVDFGIAKAGSSDAQKVTKTGLVIGTPEYMSPEQLAGDSLDGRSDIYALGLVAFNCLTGKLPFPAETVQESMIMRLTDRPRTLAESKTDVTWTTELQRTLDKALERDAGRRYQSAAQFGREFAAAISAMPATRAVEAGTLVMGAADAVPPTRVARASGATVPMDALVRATPSKQKIALPMVLGGGGALAAVGLVAFLMLKPPPAATVTQEDAPRVIVPPLVEVQPQSQTPPTQTQAKAQDKAQDKASVPVTTLSRPMNPATAADRRAGTGGADSTADDRVSLTERIRRARTVIENEGVTEDAAQLIVQRMQRVRQTPRARLTETQRADSWYVEMLAQGVLGNVAGVCSAGRQVQRLHTDERLLENARRAMAAVGCPDPP